MYLILNTIWTERQVVHGNLQLSRFKHFEHVLLILLYLYYWMIRNVCIVIHLYRRILRMLVEWSNFYSNLESWRLLIERSFWCTSLLQEGFKGLLGCMPANWSTITIYVDQISSLTADASNVYCSHVPEKHTQIDWEIDRAVVHNTKRCTLPWDLSILQ